MNVLFIVNPVAGKGSSLNAIPVIKKYCDKLNIKYAIEKTQYAGHATKLSRKAEKLGYSTVVAVGGDGTLLEVANGLIGSSLALGVIPAGTGNDFARSIGVPSNIEKALDFIVKNRSIPIDVGKAGGLCFVNVASVGFDAEIVKDVKKIQKFIPGKLSYYISVFLKFFSYKFKNIQIELDGEKINSRILLLAIANGCYYGGGMNVNPNGHLKDGYLDVIVISSLPRYKIPLLFAKFAKGNYLHLPYVKTYRARNIKIYCNEKLPVNTDGDISMQTPVEFSILPLSLKVITNSKLCSQEVLNGSR